MYNDVNDVYNVNRDQWCKKEFHYKFLSNKINKFPSNLKSMAEIQIL